MKAERSSLRVSVATYNRVVFPHPQGGTPMLALERKATALPDGTARVQSQPFGGAVRILDPRPLEALLGEIEFDSERSRRDRDFRILIPPSKWNAVKRYCLDRLAGADDRELESGPQRELCEEFAGALDVILRPEQYRVLPLGFVIEDRPVPTGNADVPGQPTVRLYRVFDVQIVDMALCPRMLAASQRYSDEALASLALHDLQSGGRGRANSVLALPLHSVVAAYRTLEVERRYRKISVERYVLDESTLAVLGELDVPQYRRVR